MNRSINVSLDTSSLDRVIRYLGLLKTSIGMKAETICDRAAEKGVELADPKLTGAIGMALSNGDDVSSSLSVERYEDGASYVADEDAIWMEFGTGIAFNGMTPGARPHPKSDELGMCAIGEYRYGNGSQLSWLYPKGDGTVGYTHGLKCTPFMLYSSIELSNQIPQIAKEVFK